MENIGIIGGGGREQAIGWSMSQSPFVDKVFYFPGNAGTRADSRCFNIPLDATSPDNRYALANLVEAFDIKRLIVGPEQPLVDGLVDFFHHLGYKGIFGPTAAASVIESRKFYSYDMNEQLGIRQAKSIKCTTHEEAEAAIKELSTVYGVVIKAQGLTAGKGVYVCDSLDEALSKLPQHEKEFGAERLIAYREFGKEFSVFGVSDGKRVLPFEIAVQDHKRLLWGDHGPNTGGMGAYCRVPFVNTAMIRDIADNYLTPVVQEMAKQGREYKGFIYAAMMLTNDGQMKVLEYNCRLGDPETQPLVMLLKDGLYQPIAAALDGTLDEVSIAYRFGDACSVVMAANGYPDKEFQKHVQGLPIDGFAEIAHLPTVRVFHAGTEYDGKSNQVHIKGGRLLDVTGYSPDGIDDAVDRTYQAVKIIDNMTTRLNNKRVFIYRTDIAHQALEM